MTDFRQKVIERFDMTLRKGQTEFTDEEILHRLESTQEAYKRLVAREAQLEARFKKLSEIAGPERTKEALDANPSEDKMTLLRWLDPKGDDFCGSGMSLEEFTVKRNISDFNRNLSSQMNDEQHRRVRLIIRIAVELQRIRQINLSNTAALESAIRDIIKGEEADHFDQTIGWMLDREPRGVCALPPEEAAAYEKREDERDALWAPAVAACREFTDAFKPVPEDRPHYDSWEEMLEKEPGMVRMGEDEMGPLWMKEVDAHHWGTPALWNLMLFRRNNDFWEETFAAGVRWRGPRKPDESGYWHREDGEKFPDNPEKFWGNNYHRVHHHRELSNWLYRQEKSA